MQIHKQKTHNNHNHWQQLDKNRPSQRSQRQDTSRAKTAVNRMAAYITDVDKFSVAQTPSIVNQQNSEFSSKKHFSLF